MLIGAFEANDPDSKQVIDLDHAGSDKIILTKVILRLASGVKMAVSGHFTGDNGLTHLRQHMRSVITV